MNKIDASQLIAEMQQLAAMSSGPSEAGQGQGDFATLMAESIDKVNATQKSAAALAEAFEKGEADVSLAEVMVALQKASLSFQAMTEVRNRLVSAYQEIMSMPV